MPPRPVFRTVVALRDALLAATMKLVPARVALYDFIGALWLSRLVYLAAKLGIADQLDGGAAKTAAELAPAAGMDAEVLGRLLRAMDSVGLLDADGERYRANALTDALRTGAPGSMRDLALFFGSPDHLRAWEQFEAAARTGKSGFSLAHGRSFWEHLADHPDQAAVFDGAMRAVTSLDAPVIAAGYPFGKLGTVCDVAGGAGVLLAEILSLHPALRGVLFDATSVIERARPALAQRGLADRCTLVGGDFFQSVPDGCDAYLLKNILHDWDDERAGRILASVRKAMKPGARLLVIEMILRPDLPRRHPGKLLDLQMLVLTEGGRQRTPDQLRALLARHSLRLSRVIPLSSPISIAEALPI